MSAITTELPQVEISVEATLDNALRIIEKLRPDDRAKLMTKLTAFIELPEKKAHTSKKSIIGLCADLGPAPTDEEFAEARREMWADFAGKKFDDI